MKNWTWKRWTALGIILAVVITCGVMHLVQPQISYAFAEVMKGGCEWQNWFVMARNIQRVLSERLSGITNGKTSITAIRILIWSVVI